MITNAFYFHVECHSYMQDLSDLNKGQIVMDRRLGQGISKRAKLKYLSVVVRRKENHDIAL